MYLRDLRFVDVLLLNIERVLMETVCLQISQRIVLIILSKVRFFSMSENNC